MEKAPEQSCHFDFAGIRQFDPPIAGLQRIEPARDEIPLLKDRSPAGKRRCGSNVAKVCKAQLPVAEPRCIELEEDIPGQIVE